MDNSAILEEMHQKVNDWLNEKPQRPIAEFMIDTMIPIIEREANLAKGAYARLAYLQKIEREYHILRPTKNKLVTVGWLGTKTAYLNISKEEAVTRYLQEYPNSEDEIIGLTEFEFDDEFGVYDAYSK